MHTWSGRVEDFDPSILLDKIDLNAENEILIRREISAMYMAIFNFWGAIEFYYKSNTGNGISREPDDFREIEFDKAMVNEDVIREIMVLSILRSASDHRLKNPASGVKFIPKEVKIRVKIDNDALRKAYESFTCLLTLLKNKCGIA